MIENFKDRIKDLQTDIRDFENINLENFSNKFFLNNFYLFATIIVSSVWVIFSIIYFVIGLREIALLQFGIAFFAMISYPILLKTKSFNWAANFVLFFSFIIEFYRIFALGGFEHSTFYTWTTVPLFAGIILSTRVNIIWTFLYLLIPLFYFIIHNHETQNSLLKLHTNIEYVTIVAIFFVNVAVLVTINYFKMHINNITEQIKKQKNEKATLIRIVSHDISNPLMVLKHNLKKLIKQFGDNPDLIRMQKSLTSIELILSHVRLLEGVSSGKLKLVLEEISIFDALKDSIEIMHEISESKNIKLVVNCDEDLKKINITAERSGLTYQIFNNILSNAIKFSPVNSEVIINILKVNSKIQLEIIDKGLGIPKNIIDKIFQFDGGQVSREGTSGEKGTGFGMPIVKYFIEKFNGSIEIKSTTQDEDLQNHGTKFILEFPIRSKS